MRKKLILGLVGVVVVAALVVANLRSGRTRGKPVEVEQVTRADVVAIVEASGQLRPAVSVDLSSDVTGRVVAVTAREGDEVSEGQLLLQIDPLQYELRVEGAQVRGDQAAARLAELEASLRQARDTYVRDQGLHQAGLLPDSSWQQTRTALEVAERRVDSGRLELASARTSLREAEDQLSKTRIESPLAGVVVRRQVDPGEVAIQGVLNNPGSLLMTVADLSRMEVEVDVDETDIVRIALGQPAEVELDAFPERRFAGTVTEVARSAKPGSSGQEQSADFLVVVTLSETDPAMRPGLSATARITTATREEALAIPIQALVVRERKAGADPDGTGGADGDAATTAAAETPPAGDDVPEPDADQRDLEGVFVVSDGEAEFRPVEVGIAGEREFEVLEGLEQGERIVVGNFQVLRTLEDGDAVRVEEAGEQDGRRKRGGDEE